MSKTYLIQGKARFAKIVGEPVPGYDNGPPEWTFDLQLDDKGVADYLATGADKFYVKERDGVQYVRFTRKASKKDGTPGTRINVVDHAGRDWDQSKLIGNGSVLNVAFVINEAAFQGKKRLKPSVISVQVWELVPYKSKSSFPTREDTPVNDTQEASNW